MEATADAAALGRPSLPPEVDLLVIGAGCAGLCAALVGALEGLDVLVCEKTAQVGGTTATSGGTIWVPGSTQARRTTTPDELDAARAYLDHEVGSWGDGALREAFLGAGPVALDYLEQNSEVKFKANSPYPDYHAEAPGGAKGGRALSPLPFDGRLLGNAFAMVRAPMPEFMVLGGMMVARNEIAHLTRPLSSLAALRTTLRLLGRHVRDRLRHPRGTRLVLGNALVARLLHSALRAGVKLSIGTRLVELVLEGERIVGAKIEREGGAHVVRARRGVVLATGGCAASRSWRDELCGRPIVHTLAFEGAQGDGLDAAMAAGAKLDRHHGSPFFWMPASTMRWPDAHVATYPHIRDRPKPGLIAVNAAGRRFVNEANSYQDFVMGMFRSDASARSVPAWLICDRRFLFEYGIGVVHPRKRSIARFIRTGYLRSAPTLAALAARIGVDAESLVETVRVHNRDAATGIDTAFGKGSAALNRHNGDAKNRPNPCLRAIEVAPFFAVEVNPAPIGSSVGLATDAHARVLSASGRAFEGLYACGNDMSSIMRGFYPGPGITLGPALVFAYLAARHAAGHPEPPGARPSAAREAARKTRELARSGSGPGIAH